MRRAGHDLEAAEQRRRCWRRPCVSTNADDDVGAALARAGGPPRASRRSCRRRGRRRGRRAARPSAMTSILSSRRARRLSRSGSAVEGGVQRRSTLTPGSPRKPRARPVVYVVDEPLDLGDVGPALPGDPRRLQLRVRRADVRVEPAAAGGDRVGRHGGLGRRVAADRRRRRRGCSPRRTSRTRPRRPRTRRRTASPGRPG